MVAVDVFPGPCRFKALIEVLMINDHEANIKIESSCRHIKLLGDLLCKVDIRECIKKFDDNLVLKLSRSIIPHPSCIIPIAILKCIEVEAGLALKENIAIVFKPCR
ncbi:MAG: hypothetical protein QXY40_10705 [Candidatus Methanomethylicia archaeon]